MPRVCWRCEGRGLLRHNTTTKDGKYLLGFIPCFCAKGKKIAAERAKNTEQPNKQKKKKRGMEMTDTERLNKLESFMRKSSSNGIAGRLHDGL